MKTKNIDNRLIKSLERRGLSEGDIDSLLNHEMKLFDPFLLKNMKKSCKRIFEAKKNNEKIIVFGDYDVDGSMAATILIDFLKKLIVMLIIIFQKEKKATAFH